MVLINMDVREKNFWVYVTMFLFYSFFGGIAEHLFHKIGTSKGFRKMTNPIITGFPIYGIGAYIVVALDRLFVNKFNVLIQFILYGAILSAFEYAAGKAIGAGPDNYLQDDGSLVFWDYTGRPLNINGLVDLEHFIIYGIFGLIVSKLHPLLVSMVNRSFTFTDRKFGQKFKKEYTRNNSIN